MFISSEAMSTVIFMIAIFAVFALSVASLFMPYYKDSTEVLVIKDRINSKNEMDLAVVGSTLSFIVLMGLLCILMVGKYTFGSSYDKTNALVFTFALLVGFVSLGLQIGGNNLACRNVQYDTGFYLYVSAIVLIFLTYAMVFYSMNKEKSIMSRLPFIRRI